MGDQDQAREEFTDRIAPQEAFEELANAANDAARAAVAEVIDGYNGPLSFQVQIVAACAGMLTAAGALASLGDKLGMNMDALASKAGEQFNEGRKGMHNVTH